LFWFPSKNECMSWKEDIKEIGIRSTDAMRQGNWNEQYSNL
jgi:hypothetical protein